MEKERRKNFTKNATRLWDANASKSLVLERSASIEELSKTGLRHEHALLLYAKKREWTKTHEGDMCAADAMKPFGAVWILMDTNCTLNPNTI